jgi:hypothetical protein
LSRSDADYSRKKRINYDMVTRSAKTKTEAIEKQIHGLMLDLVAGRQQGTAYRGPARRTQAHEKVALSSGKITPA